MRAGLAVLATGCVLLGVLPGLAMVPIARVSRLLLGVPLETGGSAGWLWLTPGGGANSYSGLVMLVAIAALAAAVVWLVHRLASNRVRRADAWDCGFPDPRPETQYSGASFAQPGAGLRPDAAGGPRRQDAGARRAEASPPDNDDPRSLLALALPASRRSAQLSDGAFMPQFPHHPRYLTGFHGARGPAALVAVSQ
jgi:hypothetical protein